MSEGTVALLLIINSLEKTHFKLKLLVVAIIFVFTLLPPLQSKSAINTKYTRIYGRFFSE